MRSKFVVFKLKNIFKYGILIFAILLMTGFSTRYTNMVIETSTENQKLLPVYSVETDEKKVAITFDCAWGADDISSIISTLEYNEVGATFFAVGDWVKKYPDSVKALYEAGMEIGNHSYGHTHVNKISYEENLEDMKKCNELLKNIIGENAKFYRGPYGEYNNTVIKAAESLNMQVIQWDIDTLDYTGKTPDEMCERIKSKIKNGSIILMHNDTKYTASRLAANY